MALNITQRFKNAWNVFNNKNEKVSYIQGSYIRPDRTRMSVFNERSIVTSVFNRIALDVSSIDIKHCKTDNNNRFKEVVDSGLNNCLQLEANIDQTSRNFLQDIVMSLFDEGCVAVVPVDLKFNPNNTESLDILSMRTGKIIEWYPNEVKVNVYNENVGKREDVIVPKKRVCIIENPLYSIMNEPNSTLQRLIRKLALLDTVDEKTNSGKLDLIVQLPYIVKSDLRKNQAEERKRNIEEQLANGKYGIAYIDGTEKITQLNRPVENNLMKQIEYLTSMLYSQLGITQAILDGTADNKIMANYYSRTIKPIILSIIEEMNRKFLTKTARTQNHKILYFRDSFSLVPVDSLADLADKFTRNEIMSSNEFRQVLGLKPSDDPKSDMLINSNMPTQQTMVEQNPIQPNYNTEEMEEDYE